METKIMKPTRNAIKLASSIINNGENVAFPTETVYGLGANALNDNAVLKIFEKKGRNQDNPLIVHFADKKDIESVAIIKNDIERLLINKCMPGPISIVLEKKHNLCNRATCGGTTIACRIPSNKVARRFIKACGCPICAPSSNTSKRPSPTTASDVFEDMCGKIPLIIDGGKCNVGVESTVVRVQNNKVYILRPGKYNKEFLSKLCKTEVILNTEAPKDGVLMSPGTKYAHYCPKVPMILVVTNIVENCKNLYIKHQSENPIIICQKNNLSKYKGMNAHSLGKNSNAGCLNLFEALRKFEKKFGYIICEFIAGGNMEDAFYNRAIKSSRGECL